VNATFKPQQLDVALFAQSQQVLHGEVALQNLERLAQDLRRDEANLAQNTVAWQAQGEVREVLGGKAQIWLHLRAQASLPLTCQRCLEAMHERVQFEQSYRFVASEKQAEEEDEASEEDVLIVSKRFNLLELLEDELLMHLPMVPKHQACPSQPKMAVQDPDFDAAFEEKPKPFAGLSALKKG
jgi:uncharacterized protein